MLSRLFRRGRERTAAATALYGAIVAKARSPALYAALGVPDTVSGRFEMVVLHAFLVFRKLEGAGPRAHDMGQAAFDIFCADMDRSLREMGVGDLGVPRRMRQVGEAFYGRTRAYAAAIAVGDEVGLAESLGHNVFKDGDAQRALPLARYVIASAKALAKVIPHTLAEGNLPFPDPAQFAPGHEGAAA